MLVEVVKGTWETAGMAVNTAMTNVVVVFIEISIIVSNYKNVMLKRVPNHQSCYFQSLKSKTNEDMGHTILSLRDCVQLLLFLLLYLNNL